MEDKNWVNVASQRAIRYNKDHTKRIYVSFNKEYDKDIIEKIENEQNKLGLIKRLLREHYFGGSN